jgi:hypothetical protein
MTYIIDRLNNPLKVFPLKDVKAINNDKSNRVINYKHPLLLKGDRPESEYTVKPDSDKLALEVWNQIFFDIPKFKVKRVDQIKAAATRAVDYFNEKYPNGRGMNEREFIQFVQASSASAFLGIQTVASSSAALDSMLKTLEQHNMHPVVHKPWLTSNLRDMVDYISLHPSIMNRSYSEVMMHAKRSSSSIPGGGKYRDYVMIHTEDELVLDCSSNKIPFLLYAGTRTDRRAKFRLVCSPDGRHRVIDFILTNGSYELCEQRGPLGCYTTEGLDGEKMWEQLKKMSNRNHGYSLACIDYKGFDTQISQVEYAELILLLNEHRLNNPKIKCYLDWMINWLIQPKPIVTRGVEELNPLMHLYTTLPSGLHGTHSFENLIGISMYRQLEKEGIPTDGFWTNGDDQNVFIADGYLNDFISFLDKYFSISWDKSLVGHKASVWGKLWFTEDFAPVSELGTIRSLFEREGGNVDIIEQSKFESNYCKVVQVIMHLIRLGIDDITINAWIKELTNRIGIRSDLIPKSLVKITPITSNRRIQLPEPKGLISVRQELIDMNLPNNLLQAANMYDLMSTMYHNVTLFTMETQQIDYHSHNTNFRIKAGKNYSVTKFDGVPNNIRELMLEDNQSETDIFIRSVIQNTKSFEGPLSDDYSFYDMLSLAKVLVKRNAAAWTSLSVHK